MTIAGHVWTVVPTARDVVWRPRALASTEHAVAVVDDWFGPTTVPCSLAVPFGATAVVVLVHGLGGSRHAAYVQRAATELHRLGFAVLALDLRGADRRGGGFYHVAMTEDLAAVCSSPLLAPFARVFVLGFSMGGHAALWFAGARSEPRLRGVASVCTPLDLAATQQHLDARPRSLYRHWVLRGLKHIYDAVARRHPVPTPAEVVWRCATFHEWDALTIAPRYGHPSPEHFYRERSAARALPQLAVETVLVLAKHDPVVPPALALPWVGRAPAGRLRVCVAQRGGHLQFPHGVDLGLGQGGEGSVVEQLGRHWHRV
ncbi:MAG TPA: alpha/beta fold hydrolase [Planctomycetota bacterium]|nr:alpha/beta fold hydrolase [Planctomycetota bacterium]